MNPAIIVSLAIGISIVEHLASNRPGFYLRRICLIRSIKNSCLGQVASSIWKKGFDMADEIFDCFPFRILTYRALAGDASKSIELGKRTYRLFADVNQRADDGDSVRLHFDLWQIRRKFGLVE